MKRTILTLALACQMAAGAAFAQTETTTAATETGAMSGSYGSDWSLSLGPSLFGEDGTTLRTDSELATQWETLPEEDRAMLRRDCMAHSQQSGMSTDATAGATTDTGTTAETGASTDTGTTAETGTTDTTAGATAAADAGSPMMVNAEQMERICMVIKDL